MKSLQCGSVGDLVAGVVLLCVSVSTLFQTFMIVAA
jgi:hypothetical protein